jgi:hypothetical protein
MPLWLCPVNEPLLYPAMAGVPRAAAIGMALTMSRVAKDHHPDVRILTTDPITGIGEQQFACTDALVAAGIVDVVGVNYYPHTARTVLRKVLVKTWRRYRKPVLVSETSWHDGHPHHRKRYPGFSKATWFHHIAGEVAVAVAEAAGVDVAGICWYLMGATSSRSIVAHESIAHTWLGPDDPRLGRIALDLAAQLPNEHPQIVEILAMRGAPHQGEQGPVRHDAASASCQQHEKIIFLRGQVDRGIVAAD